MPLTSSLGGQGLGVGRYVLNSSLRLMALVIDTSHTPTNTSYVRIVVVRILICRLSDIQGIQIFSPKKLDQMQIKFPVKASPLKVRSNLMASSKHKSNLQYVRASEGPSVRTASTNSQQVLQTHADATRQHTSNIVLN